MNSRHNKRISNCLLLFVAAIWGFAFVAQSVGMDYVGPWTFVFSRYVLSAVVLIPVTVFTDKNIHVPEESRTPGKIYLKGGVSCGVLLGLASIAQQAGIQYTTAGKAGFITALYVVLVPVLGLFLGKRPQKKIWFCVALGILGLYLISVKGNFSIAPGDALVMLCALIFSCQILCVDHFSPLVDNPVKLANLQFLFAALVNLAGMLVFEKPSMEGILSAAVPIIYAGVVSGGMGYTIQIVAQKNTEPTVASLLMSLEAVFSVLAGWLLLHQTLTARELAGCGIVLAAVIISVT